MIIYLYIKQHTVTGLKYFGKTEKNPFKYHGSGSYWSKHVKKHGKHFIKTVEVWGFDNIEACTEFALNFSKENDIVQSTQWANLQEENGIDGAVTGEHHHMRHMTNPMLGKTHSKETRQKISEARKILHASFSDEQKEQHRKQTIRASSFRHTPEKDAEHSRKMKGRMAGEKNPQFGKPGTMLGKKHTPEALVKIKEAAQRRSARIKLGKSVV